MFAATCFKRIRPEYWLITALAAALIFGSPNVYANPDSVAPHAMAILRYTVPRFYHYPGLVLYLDSLAYGAADAWHRMHARDDIAVPYDYSLRRLPEAQTDYDLPARVTTFLFSLLGLWAVYASVELLTKQRLAASFGALTLLLAPFWLLDSHLPTVDIALAALCASTVAALIYTVQSQKKVTWPWYLALGIGIGLAAAAKYNGAIVGLAVAVTLLWHGRTSIKKTLGLLCAAATAALIVFVLINPGIISEWPVFRSDLAYEFSHASQPGTGYGTTGASLGYHLSVNLPTGFGLLPLALALIGLIWYTTRKSPSSVKIALLSFPIIFLGTMGSSTLPFARYILPVLPTLAIGCGLCIYLLTQELARSPAGLRTLAFGTCVLALSSNITLAIMLKRTLAAGDTRISLMRTLQTVRAILPTPISASGYVHGITEEYVGARQITESTAEAAVALIDSFSFDRQLFDKETREKTFYGMLNHFKHGSVVSISPFGVAKDQVPFSPDSMCGPYPFDLPDRTQAGPYIELYARDPLVAQKLFTACSATGSICTIHDAVNGYYYRATSLPWTP